MEKFLGDACHLIILGIEFKNMNKTFLSLLLIAFCVTAEAKVRPNVVFILADDLGWDDVGFHGSEIKTPNIDKLATEGVILNNYYVQPICTPTRGALLSGRYPIHTGLQHYVIAGSQPYGLPLDEITVAQHLKSLGYSTHAVGKWHLGFCTKGYLPENRGFDSHLGYYLGVGDYFDHYGHDGGFMGYDFHHNGEVLWKLNESYSTDIFTSQADSIIQSHDISKPLFLYLAFQAVHVGNAEDKIQVPQIYVDRFPYIKDIKRRLFAGVVSALDDAVGKVYQSLQESGLLENTVIIFSTDNGGPANGYDGNAACNWPLRGTKNTLWQGGVRGVGFVHSPLLQKQNYVNNNLIHVTDWLPTIYSIAGGNSSALKNVDGTNQWEVISQNASAARQEVLLNIDPIVKHESLIVGDFKIIYGDISDGRNDGWYPPPDSTAGDETLGADNTKTNFYHDKYLDDYLKHSHSHKYASTSDATVIQQSDIAKLVKFMNSEYEHLKKRESSSNMKPNSLLFESERNSFANSEGFSVKVDCGQKPENASENCKPEEAACLYNIRDDPCEFNNLALAMPSVVTKLQERMEVYRKTMVPPGNKPIDPKGNPQLHGGVWGPWL